MITELGSWLVQYQFVRSLDEAERLCERGSVRVDGKTISNVHFIPKEGSSISTLENAYTVLISEQRVQAIILPPKKDKDTL